MNPGIPVTALPASLAKDDGDTLESIACIFSGLGKTDLVVLSGLGKGLGLELESKSGILYLACLLLI